MTMLDEQEKVTVHARSGERRRSRVPTPVFVDGSGRRHTWLARSLVGLAVLCVGYAGGVPVSRVRRTADKRLARS